VTRRLLLTAAVSLAWLAAAPALSAAPPKVATVVIDKLAFGPSPTGLRAGDIVEWVNRDIFRHTVTGAGFDLDLQPGARGRLVLRGVGTVAYTCRYHPGMKAQIVIGR
jgi:plastocyanin